MHTSPVPYPVVRLAARVLLGALIALLFLVSGCAPEEPTTPLPPLVRTVAVAPGTTSVASFSGVTRAAVESRVAFQVGGVVSDVTVEIGDRVRRGSVVAQLDPADFTLRAQQARSGLQQAESQARLAEADYDRVRRLYEQGVVPVSQYDAARARLETVQAGATAARDQVALAERGLGYARLTAPVGGAIAEVLVEAGELVAPGQPVALVTTQGSPMEVTVSVPERVVTSLRAGDAATVTLTAFGDTAFTARITEVGVAAGRGATTFPVVVRLDRADADMRSGMTARVEFATEAARTTATGPLVVPVAAVNADTEGAYVMVVEAPPADTTMASGDLAPTHREVIVRRRAVETGTLRSDGVEVTGGLARNDHVVAAGLGELADGQRVRLADYDPLARDLLSFSGR
ncbi:MAG: efflux RND transporter periplasmic adaptor subunit [Bacteroidota bacterium]